MISPENLPFIDLTIAQMIPWAILQLPIRMYSRMWGRKFSNKFIKAIMRLSLLMDKLDLENLFQLKEKSLILRDCFKCAFRTYLMLGR
jgi:hypothetical protein